MAGMMVTATRDQVVKMV